MAGKISQMTAAAVGDLAATTSDLEVSINVTTAPLTRRSTLGTLATWLATVGFLASTLALSGLIVGSDPGGAQLVRIGGSVKMDVLTATTGTFSGGGQCTAVLSAIRGEGKHESDRPLQHDRRRGFDRDAVDRCE